MTNQKKRASRASSGSKAKKSKPATSLAKRKAAKSAAKKTTTKASKKKSSSAKLELKIKMIQADFTKLARENSLGALRSKRLTNRKIAAEVKDLRARWKANAAFDGRGPGTHGGGEGEP